MKSLGSKVQEYHVSIRKESRVKQGLRIRNQYQKILVINYVKGLNIPKQPCYCDLEALQERFSEQRNDLDLKQELYNHLVSLVKFMNQNEENMKMLVTSRLPAMVAAVSESFPNTRVLSKYTNQLVKCQNLLKYVFYKIDQYIQNQNLLKSINQKLFHLLSLKELNNQSADEANLIILYFSNYICNETKYEEFCEKGYLQYIMSLLKMPICYQYLVVEEPPIKSRSYREEPPQDEEVKKFSPLLTSCLIFYRNFLSSSTHTRYLTQETRGFLYQLTLRIINNYEFYMHEVDYRCIKVRVEHLMHAVYIYNALLLPSQIDVEVKLEDIWGKLAEILGTRFRHYALFRYITHIAIKFIKHSQQYAMFLMHAEVFTDLIKCSQRISQHESCDVLALLLDYPESQEILRSTIIIMLLDIPKVVEHIRHKLFKIMFKFYGRKNFKANDPESFIILKIVAENQWPFPVKEEELSFWVKVLESGYSYPIPTYIKDDVYDMLTERQREDVELRCKGEKGFRW